MQDRRAPFMELCRMKEDCIEMSWNVEYIFYMTGIIPPSRSTEGLAFSPCPRMNARTIQKKKEEEAIPNLFCREVLILPYGFLLSDDPILVEKNSCFVRRNANFVSKERKIRCVLTGEWSGTYS
ncbi:hypothetical protein NC653_031916 [Populus alba x Populus x berolinensis]|uniref:Uncharacterized protein n=1 Tax=Populus alba x Populus x berolinensis TaxID=444605 RepID=A0AAD6LZL7_9ROSI|nr:hypothetical protein NC653_031916 [Populus alba x Populus x berolinensis]